MSDTKSTPRPPDLTRRTLSPVGYVICAVVPVLVAAIGITILHFGYDKEDLVDGRTLPLLTSDWKPGDVSEHALLTGELNLGQDGCVRVADQVVVWPADYEATVQRVGRSDQLKLYDADRDIVGRTGDTVELGGGSGDGSEYAGRPCAPTSGDVFFVQSEVKVVGAS